VRDDRGVVQTEVLEVSYADGVKRKLRRPLLEIFEPKNEKEVEKGTSKGGSATCPVTGFTTQANHVKTQLSNQVGGADNARLTSVYIESSQGRRFRMPNLNDLKVFQSTKNVDLSLSLVQDKQDCQDAKINPIRPYKNTRGLSAVTRIGCNSFADLYNRRQLLCNRIFHSIVESIDDIPDYEMKRALITILALAANRLASQNSSVSRWDSTRLTIKGAFSKQALAVVWDFAEANPLSNGSSNWQGAIDWIIWFINVTEPISLTGQVFQSSATELFLPIDSVSAIITDPPYFAAIPYGDLSDFFYVWLRRSLKKIYPDLLKSVLVDKTEELIVTNCQKTREGKLKDENYFRSGMTDALSKARQIAIPSGIGVVIYAEATTVGWEAILSALIDAGWIVTASWSIDTEMQNRTRANGTASLQSSVHLVCRPRENPDGTLREEIGDWRDVLQELPKRIKEWMPRLTEQGVVGADAIFACLGPALEIFSRYSSVEKASGEIVPLREYLEYVWAAISKEALSTIFKDADTSNFEEDARLTAMWLWTLSADPSPSGANTTDTDKMSVLQEDETDDDDEENTGKKAKVTGFSLEYDAARKIAQGLGAHLETLTHLVEVKGDKARLLPVKERAAYLFGKEGITPDIPKKKAKGDKQLTITGILAELPEDEHGEIQISRIGETVCDKVHQAMLLFNSGRSEALKRFLVDEGIGNDTRFWQLAQSFSALYPAGTDEKRWVDGLLARKKGLGL
jgi:adenine-specific DNA methylase